MPLISIVIPTRNRAYLLQTAIQSALSQNFDDFEVVVSDNYSTDATFETVNKFNDPRLRYVKTSKAMHMPDSWEFALEQARGEYITFLSDDDAIHPNLLKISWNAVTRTSCDIIVWPFGGIYYHDVFHSSFRGRNSADLVNLKFDLAIVGTRHSGLNTNQLFSSTELVLDCTGSIVGAHGI